MARWIFLVLAFCLSGCFAVPIFAFEVTCSVTSAALGAATDSGYGSRVVSDSTSSQLFAGMAEDARSDEGIKEDVSPRSTTALTMAKKACAKAGAGPDTDCVDYLTQSTDWY